MWQKPGSKDPVLFDRNLTQHLREGTLNIYSAFLSYGSCSRKAVALGIEARTTYTYMLHIQIFVNLTPGIYNLNPSEISVFFLGGTNKPLFFDSIAKAAWIWSFIVAPGTPQKQQQVFECLAAAVCISGFGGPEKIWRSQPGGVPGLFVVNTWLNHDKSYEFHTTRKEQRWFSQGFCPKSYG